MYLNFFNPLFVTNESQKLSYQIIIKEKPKLIPKGVAISKSYFFTEDTLFVADNQGHWLSLCWSEDTQPRIFYHPSYNKIKLSKILEWVVHQLAAIENLVFLHAMGFASGESALVCPAWLNTGKTRALMHLLNEGNKLIGDDWIVLDSRGGVWAFPKAPLLYLHDLRELPRRLRQYLGQSQKFVAALASCGGPLLNKILTLALRYKFIVELPVAFPVDKLPVVHPYKLIKVRKVLYLVRSCQTNFSCEALDKETFVARAMNIYQYEYNNLLHSSVWRYAFPKDVKLFNHYKRVQELLSNLFFPELRLLKIPLGADGTALASFLNKEVRNR